MLVKVSSIVIQIEHYQFEGKCVGEWPTQLETNLEVVAFIVTT